MTHGYEWFDYDYWDLDEGYEFEEWFFTGLEEEYVLGGIYEDIANESDEYDIYKQDDEEEDMF